VFPWSLFEIHFNQWIECPKLKEGQMNFRKLNQRIPIVFLALVFSLIISTAQTLPVWADETPVMSDQYVPMRDSVLLFTKVFLPDPAVWGPGPYPTILSTTPYGVGAPGASPPTWPSQPLNGYAYVYQDTRGRNYSEGVWSRQTDGVDGYDTIEWIAKQPWCNGCKIGMSGASAGGITTYLTSGQRPPHLVAIQPTIASANSYNNFTFEGQAYEFETGLAWSAYTVQGLSASHIASLGLTPAQLGAAYATYGTVLSDLFTHTGNPPLPLPVTSQWWMYLPMYNFPGISPFLPGWNETLLHPSQDEWRNSWNVQDKIKVPGLHWGGWYDIFSRGTLEAFQHAQKNVGKQKLLITNGSHMTVSTKFPYDPYYQWFDYWLKGVDTGIMDEPPIIYYRMVDTTATVPSATGEWRYADQWPLPDVKKEIYYLRSNGTISTHFPSRKESSETYLYDPNNPVPSMGGRNLFIHAGAVDQSSVEPPNRNDVLVYTSEVLQKDLEIGGNVKVFLHASSNCKDTDFTAKLIDVYPDGRTMLILDGVIRARYRESLKYEKLMHPGKIYEFTIDLGDTSQVFKAGHRIQVDISSSNFPRRDRNTNTGNALYIIDTNDDAIIARNTIYHDAKHPSFVVLPIVHPQTRIFEGQASIKTPKLTYEGPAEFYTLAKGVYLRLTNLDNRWVKWDIEHDCNTRFVDSYRCEGKLGKLSVKVHAEGREPYYAIAWGKGVSFKGSPKVD
jgi:predicted acyl esterase